MYQEKKNVNLETGYQEKKCKVGSLKYIIE